MLLLLLLQLIVEGLELAVLVGRTPAENRVDVLAERDLRAEAIHLVIVGARLHSYGGKALLVIFAVRGELIKVWRLLHHANAPFVLSEITLPD